MIKSISFCLLLLGVAGCQQGKNETGSDDNTATLAEYRWLEGKWVNRNDSPTIFYETWDVVNDTLMRGRGFGIENGDTVFNEQLELKTINGKVYYLPNVSGQNNNKPVFFSSEYVSDSEFTFVNRNHDFPNKICYTKVGDDSLYAWIEGVQQNKPVKMDFPFKRVK